MINCKRFSIITLIFSILIPLFPISVFADGNSDDIGNESIEKVDEYNDNNYIYQGTITEEKVDVWEVESNKVKYIDTIDLTNEVVNVVEEVVVGDREFALIHNDLIEIGWIEISDSNLLISHEEELESDVQEVVEPEESTSVQEHENVKEIIEIEEELNSQDYSENKSGNSSLSTLSVRTRSAFHQVISESDVSYAAEVIHPWSINTRPWGTEGADLVTSAQPYVGSTVEVVKEKVTPRSTFALIKTNGRELGWIDTTGLKPHTITNTKDVKYSVEVTKPWSINSQPWGIRGFENVNHQNAVGEEFLVTKEAITPRSTFGLLTKNGKEIGWIDSSGYDKTIAVHSKKDISYAAKVVKPWSINTRPWGTTGAKQVIKNGELVGKEVLVTQEKVTDRGTFSLIHLNGEKVGWVDKTALDVHTVQSNKTVNYSVEITHPWSINSKPWGIEGFETLTHAKIGDSFEVVEEAVTPRSKYVLLKGNGKEVGWIDSTGAEERLSVLSTKNVSYAADVIKPWSINSQPWGTAGAQPVIETGRYVGKTVTVKEEKTTVRGTYALISIGNTEIGWIDKTGLLVHAELSNRPVEYNVKITQPWSINTKPWGIDGFEQIQSAESLIGEEFKVIRESVTPRSMYMLLERNNQILGWIDSTGVRNTLTVTSTTNKNYSARIVKPWSINTEPWGTRGSQVVPNHSQFLGKRVEVIQEKVTQRGTYSLIRYQGQVLGWIDKTGLDTRTTIVIDPGHGGRDPGAQGTLNGRVIKEKDLNLSISLKLRDRLESQGYNVVMTRESDIFIEMVDRARMANDIQADIFVSIHHNNMPGNNAAVNGIETIYYHPSSNYPPIINGKMHNNATRIAESKKLAHSVQDSLISATDANYRRVFGGAYVVVRETTMPAIIPELGFMSNPTELRRVTTSSYQELLIRGLVNGINNYFNN